MCLCDLVGTDGYVCVDGRHVCEGQRITSGVVHQVPSPFCLRQGLSVARSFIKEVMLAGHGLPPVPTFHLAIVGLLTTNHFVAFCMGSGD